MQRPEVGCCLVALVRISSAAMAQMKGWGDLRLQRVQEPLSARSMPAT